MSAIVVRADLVAAYAILIAPLIGALAAFVIPHLRSAWIISAISAAVTAASGIVLAARGATIAPFGVRLDPLACAAAPIIAIAGALCVLAAVRLVREDAGPRAATLSLALLQFGWFGWLGAAFASHFLLLLGFFEIGWIATCALVALSAWRDRAALPAAARQIAWGAAFGIVLAIGFAITFSATGALDFAELREPTARPRALAAAFALMFVAVAGAAGLAPLNAATLAAFDRGGRIAPLFIGGVAIPALLVALARIAMSAHGAGPGIAHGVSVLLAVLGAASMAIGSAQAIGAQDLRRLAAYATAAQAGAVTLSFAVISATGAAAGVMHIAVLSLAALGILGGGAMISPRASLQAIDGVGWRSPLAGAAIAASALSLVGAPLSIGFVSRWRLVEGALQAGWWWAAGALIAASLAAVVYAGRLVERLYLRAPAPAAPSARPFGLAPEHAVIVAATIGLGLDASGLWRVALNAGEALLRSP